MTTYKRAYMCLLVSVFSEISIFLCGILLASSVAAAALPADAEEKYQLTLKLYKEGQCEQSESMISQLREAFPEIDRFRADLIAISVGCKNYRPVLKYISDAYLVSAPQYVKDALLEAALQENDIQAAMVVQRNDHQISTRLMNRLVEAVYSALSVHDLSLADQLSRQILSLYPSQVKAWDTRGYVLREEGEYFHALRIYQQMQSKFPRNREAPLAIAKLLQSLGMPQAAAEQIVTKGITLTPRESFQLQKDIAVRELRWSDTYDHQPQKRRAYVNRAIKGLLAARQLAIANDLDPADIRSVDCDLVVAYEIGHQYQNSIELFELLTANRQEVPTYVQLAAADSYSRAHQYQKSEALYREYLLTDPENIDATLGLYYSLVDQDRFEEANSLLDKVAETLQTQLLSARRRSYLPGDNREFVVSIQERYTSVRIAQANALTYRDRLDDASHKVGLVLDDAPASDNALIAKGNVELLMGNPRKAEDYFKIVSYASPENTEAQVGLANTDFDLRNYQSFNKTLDQLQENYADQHDVKELLRKREIHQSPLLTGDFEFANGKRSTQDLNSATADMRVYSEPLNDNYRAYARFRGLYSGPAVQSNVSAGALGLKYEGESHELSVEGGDRGYAKLEGTQYISDSLSGSLSFERNGFYLFPGALYPIYTGNVIGGVVNWKNNDRQKALVGYQYWSLTNNNQTQAFANFSQRLITDYNYKLEGSLWVGNQQNTNPNVGYFAPWNQTEYSGTATFEFMQWRDLETKKYSFWHKFWGTYGVVTQQGFSTLAMNSVGYGQNFTFGDRQRVVWGIGRTYFPFDGVQSSYMNGYLRFEKSF